MPCIRERRDERRASAEADAVPRSLPLRAVLHVGDSPTPDGRIEPERFPWYAGAARFTRRMGVLPNPLGRQVVSNNADTICGRLGAHLQSLTVPAGSTGVSDSGFVLGNYSAPPPPPSLPEPGTLSLLGAVFLTLGMLRLRQRRR